METILTIVSLIWLVGVIGYVTLGCCLSLYRESKLNEISGIYLSEEDHHVG